MLVCVTVTSPDVQWRQHLGAHLHRASWRIFFLHDAVKQPVLNLREPQYSTEESKLSSLPNVALHIQSEKGTAMMLKQEHGTPSQQSPVLITIGGIDAYPFRDYTAHKNSRVIEKEETVNYYIDRHCLIHDSHHLSTLVAGISPEDLSPDHHRPHSSVQASI